MGRSLARAAKYEGRAGEPLPCPFPALQALKFAPRLGQLSLWVAAPGGGKSLLALNYALKAGVPCLYVSADTDRNDMSDRTVACLTGVPTWQITDEMWTTALAKVPPDVQFEFDSGPTPHDIADMLEGYGAVWGQYPKLIVVDTLSKVWTDVGDENARNREAVDRCQEIARETGGHVMLLHHATKMYDKGNEAIPLDGLMSGVSKIPEQVVTMFRDKADRVALCVVKNRSGKADASANTVRAFVQFNFETMNVGEVETLTGDWWQKDEGLTQGVYA